MELKSHFFEPGNGLDLRSNRTFMELKFRTSSIGSTIDIVLIAPLWN